MDSQVTDYLKSIYYQPKHPASYGGINKLYKAVKTEGKFKLKRKQVAQWLKSQETYTLHRPGRRRFPRRKVIVGHKFQQADMDLMDMSRLSPSNNGYRFLLVVIDDFSRFAWVIPVKNKSGASMLEGFKKLFASKDFKVLKVRSDKGMEFRNRLVQEFLKDRHVEHFLTQNETKAALAERFIRTLKKKLYAYMNHHQSLGYINKLQDIVDSYNHSYHRTLKMSPAQVTETNSPELWMRLYQPDLDAPYKPVKFKFVPGEYVRISFLRQTFTRDFEQKFSDEIYKVASRKIRQGVPVYTLTDYAGDEVIEGTFYEYEMQAVDKNENQVYRIERIIRKRTRRGVKEALVRWAGWSSKYDSWLPESQVKRYKSDG